MNMTTTALLAFVGVGQRESLSVDRRQLEVRGGGADRGPVGQRRLPAAANARTRRDPARCEVFHRVTSSSLTGPKSRGRLKIPARTGLRAFGAASPSLPGRPRWPRSAPRAPRPGAPDRARPGRRQRRLADAIDLDAESLCIAAGRQRTAHVGQPEPFRFGQAAHGDETRHVLLAVASVPASGLADVEEARKLLLVEAERGDGNGCPPGYGGDRAGRLRSAISCPPSATRRTVPSQPAPADSRERTAESALDREQRPLHHRVELPDVLVRARSKNSIGIS